MDKLVGSRKIVSVAATRSTPNGFDYCGGIEAFQKAGCTIEWAWQGGEAETRDTFRGKLVDCIPVYVEAISDRCSKDNSSAHKREVVSWLQHNML